MLRFTSTKNVNKSGGRQEAGGKVGGGGYRPQIYISVVQAGTGKRLKSDLGFLHEKPVHTGYLYFNPPSTELILFYLIHIICIQRRPMANIKIQTLRRQLAS